MACISLRVGAAGRGYQPRPMSQKNEQPEPSRSPSTRHVIITLPAWPQGTTWTSELRVRGSARPDDAFCQNAALAPASHVKM